MRSLLVISAFLCVIGLATAAPLDDLLKSLLKTKRDQADDDDEVLSLSEIEALSDEPYEYSPAFVPTEAQFYALGYMGWAIKFFAETGAESPKDLIELVVHLIHGLEGTEPEERELKGLKHSARLAARSLSQSKMMRKRQSKMMHKRQDDNALEDEFMNEILSTGLYPTIMKHVYNMGLLLQHSGAIFQHAIHGESCSNGEETCEELPAEVINILLGMAGEEGVEAPGSPEEGEGDIGSPESPEEEAPSPEPIVEKNTRALLRRLLTALSQRKK